MKINDYILQAKFPNEEATLKQSAFLVNIRLYKSSEHYRDLINNIIKYLGWYLSSAFEGYERPRGISAAVLGIPLSIIGYKDTWQKNRFYINAKIAAHSDLKNTVRSNCECYQLNQPTQTYRYSTIDLEFYDLNGHKVIQKNIGYAEGSYVIQHELNHCYGKTIVEKDE